MNAKAIRALKASVRKWKRIAAGSMGSEGPDNCPLCALYYHQEKTCAGCPVAAFTKKDCCQDTPYDAWEELSSDELRKEGDQDFVFSELSKYIALAEASFLRALLPRSQAQRDSDGK